MVKQKKIRRKKGNKFFSGTGKFFLSLLVVYLTFYAANKIVEISKDPDTEYSVADIQIEGNHLVPDKKILAVCSFNPADKQVRKIEPESVAEKLAKLHYVKGVSVTRRPPRILNITLEERQPVAFIYGRGLNLIDEEGLLMPLPSADFVWDLPLISGIRERLGRLGERSSASETYLALEIVSILQNENPLLAAMISEINFRAENFIELYIVKGGATIRINRNSYHRELFVLKSYLANYLDWRQLAKIEYIDLRFRDQLIVKHKV